MMIVIMQGCKSPIGGWIQIPQSPVTSTTKPATSTTVLASPIQGDRPTITISTQPSAYDLAFQDAANAIGAVQLLVELASDTVEQPEGSGLDNMELGDIIKIAFDKLQLDVDVVSIDEDEVWDFPDFEDLPMELPADLGNFSLWNRAIKTLNRTWCNKILDHDS